MKSHSIMKGFATGLVALSGLCVAAHSNFSASTKMALGQIDNVAKKNACVKRNAAGRAVAISTFVEVSSDDAWSQLEKLGVKVQCKWGNLATALIPLDAIDEVGQLATVRRVDAARPMSLHNDGVRAGANVDDVHSGNGGLLQPYTGKGVLIGMVDCGIEFNHIEFQDANGKSRVKRVYMPADHEGTNHPVVDGNTLPGAQYVTPEEIAALTTDCEGASHGTHTTTTAAGSYKGNKYYGVATDADLVLCGVREDSLTDVNIANSVAYIVDYAKKENRPVVVNLSLGDVLGPHDGTSPLCRAINSMAGPQQIMVLSAGNDGHAAMHLNRTFATATDTLRTILTDKVRTSGYFSAWSRDSRKLRLQVVMLDESKKQCWASEEISEIDSEDGYVIDCAAIPQLAEYFDGTITLYSAIDDVNGKFQMVGQAQLLRKNKAFIGLKFIGDPGQEMDAWSAGTYFCSYGQQGWTDGSSVNSISDLVTGDNTISVGASTSKSKQMLAMGMEMSFANSEFGDIAFFSSYGPDANGVARPEVVAGGYGVASGASIYDDESWIVRSNLVEETTIDDRTYRWGVEYGTSMSCPAVVGCIALWLEADPTLTLDDVRKVIKATSIRDSFVESDTKGKWGAGKIDALKGLQYITETGGIDALASDRLWCLNAQDDQLSIVAPISGDATVEFFDVAGRLLAHCSAVSADGSITLDIPQQLPSGIYLVKAQVGKRSHTFKVGL